ncbi:MAG: histone deacetylase [Promethearchaeota archaeon]
MEKTIAIISDEEFMFKHIPPYPRPSFYSNEHPLRIKVIRDYMKKRGIFNDTRFIFEKPIQVGEKILKLAHSKYNIDMVNRLSNLGHGLIGDEVFITKTTFSLAKKALGGAIKAIEMVLSKQVLHSLALIRPPGHHASRERPSGLCIFNNIANAIFYLRKVKVYKKKIAIVDIDDHFGDGIAQFFYDDPSVLYFSIHEYDFEEGDIGFLSELGEGEGLGKNVNFPVPIGIIDSDFLELTDILEPILKQFQPDVVIVAMGFDMYWNDPVGNCLLTSKAYHDFTKWMVGLTHEICEGKLAFVLEGGYSLTGLPVCVHSVLKALLKEEYERPEFEYMDFSDQSKASEIVKIKDVLRKELKKYWIIK